MKKYSWKISIGIVAVTLFCASATDASEFRKPRPIVTPENIGAGNLGPVVKPVARERIEAAVAETYSRYNTPAFREILAEEFFDGSRLSDAIIDQVPRDATMRVLSIGNVRTFGQNIRTPANSSRNILTSVVSVTVRAQMEFTGADGQFVRTEGTNELILHIHEEY